MSKKSETKSEFGRFLDDKKAGRRDVAAELDITSSYVSMLCRASAKPGLKLALRIAAWTKNKYGVAFAVENWA